MNKSRLLCLMCAFFFLMEDIHCYYVFGDDPKAQLPNAAVVRLQTIKAFQEERDELREYRKNLRSRRDMLKGELDQIEAVNRWALDGFRDTRDSSSESAGESNLITERWRRIDSLAAQRFVDFDSGKSQTNIATGQALNFLMDVLENVALKHDRYLENHQQFANPRIPETERQMQSDVLWAIEDATRIDKSALDHIQFEYGLSGPKLRVQLSQLENGFAIEPLPLNWPSFFLQTKKYAGLIQEIDEARKSSILELNVNILGGPGQQQLMNAIDQLQREFEGHRARQMRGSLERAELYGRAGVFDPTTFNKVGESSYQLLEAMKFLKTLRYSTSRLIESRYLKIAPFQSLRNDGNYTVVQLIAYMKVHGLRFAPAGPGTEHKYQQLFFKMRSYYRTLLSLQVAVSVQKGRIQDTQSEIELANKEITELLANEVDVAKGARTIGIGGWLLTTVLDEAIRTGVRKNVEKLIEP